MTDFEDAEALYEAEKDPFYLAAFFIQHWLGGLLLRAAAEYAEKKNPKERSTLACAFDGFAAGVEERLRAHSVRRKRGACPDLE